MSVRIGHGFDVHRLVKGRALTLGGIGIPFDLGLEGHSDADVLLHAICDALLGAAGLGDIGLHFPDSDPAHQNRNSREFLRHVHALISERGYAVSKIDSTNVAQAPRLSGYVSSMEENIARDL
ncbi:MAG: 2-C-methyl-D-erythritol 2,4-cyclodiphosphate synthase, partial [Arenicellales bacterium]